MSLTPTATTHLKRDLAIVVSAEALFTLTDLCGLSVDDAIASAVRAATALTTAAFTEGARRSIRPLIRAPPIRSAR